MAKLNSKQAYPSSMKKVSGHFVYVMVEMMRLLNQMSQAIRKLADYYCVHSIKDFTTP